MQLTAGSGNPSEPTDERLLHDYVTGQDAAAFAAIVRRHGAMVLGVCRRVLHHEHDAEDAFQATFVVLLHKARSLTRPKLLGNWLYGVAYRTALKARLAAVRRRQRERPIVNEPPAKTANEAVWNDLRPILDDELHRLPEKYRAPVVLCYLEGQTTQEAARTLGCPKGTVLSRLARARQQLRGRFSRRGLALSTGVLATLLSRTASSEGGVPAALLQSSVPNLGLATPERIAPRVSASAADLAQQILRSMLLKRLQSAAVLLLATLAGICVAVSGYRNAFAPRMASAEGRFASDAEELQGKWEVVAVERDGLSLPEEQFAFTQLTIRGETIIAQTGTGAQEMTFPMDSMSSPKNIDILTQDYKNQTRYGIYALDGNTLKICWPEKPGRYRPRAFATTPKSAITLITCKRMAP
jgi:RNA polymerase sigma factor (sigma-70 family)